MALNTNFNTNPYFDDYNEEKDFLRILFRPGVAVQARELTQLQTILQKQIERFGTHAFEDGSKVLGGNLTIDNDVTYLKLFPTYEAQGSSVEGTNIDITNWVNQVIEQPSTGAKARVIHVESATATEENTLYIKTINGIDFLPNSAGIDARIEYIVDSNTFNARVGGTRPSIATGEITDPIGIGSLANVDAGVFYVSGFFVRCDVQTIPLEKYSTTPSFRIGLSYDESIIESFDDESLLDNANGSSNFTAPGAHRFKISLTLTKTALSTEKENFIELTRLDRGVIQRLNVNPLYNELGKQIARRTYEESGNYTTRPFNIRLEDYDPKDENKFKVILDSGKAFVHGFEYETMSTESLDVNRALNTNFVDEQQMYVRFGNYVVIDYIVGLFDINSQEEVDLYSVQHESIANTSLEMIGTANVTSYVKSGSNTRLHLRNMKFEAIQSSVNTQATLGTNTIVLVAGSATDQAYRGMILKIGNFKYIITNYIGSTRTATVDSVFSFNITSTTNVEIIADSKNINSFLDVTGDKKANVALTSKVNGIQTNATTISETDLNTLVFNMNDSYVKSLRDPSVNARYIYQTGDTVTFSGGSGSYTVTAASDEIYPGVQGALTTDDYSRFFLYKADGTAVNVTGASVTGKTITFNTDDTTGFTADAILLIQSEGATERTKTFTSANTSVLSTSTNAGLGQGQLVIGTPNTIAGNAESLLVSDILNIEKIIDIGRSSIAGSFDSANTATWSDFNNTVYNEEAADITSSYRFFNGQKNYFYDHGNISLIAGKNKPIGPIIVFFNYFEPSAIGSQQGFFSVDSYQGIDYNSIPSYGAIRLRDALDFRPVRDKNTTSFDGGVRLPHPGFTFTTDYTYYLSRIDKLLLTKNRTFEILEGIPDTNPFPPADVDSAMTIYQLTLPPFTSNIEDVVITPVDNSRYTMKDINNLEKRIRMLESDAVLSKLERETLDTVTFDDLGIERFINGALVDNFSGHSTGDVENLDYNVSIDANNRELRPPFNSEGINLNLATGVNYHSSEDGLVTMDYTDADFAVQGLASKSVNVNPYNVTNFNGSVKLNPMRDVWHDKSARPAVTINLSGNNDAWLAIGRAVEDSRNNGFGTEWNDWQTRWTGTTTTELGKALSTTVNSERDGRRITTTTSTTREQVISRGQEQFRTGTRTSWEMQTIRRNSGSKVVDVSVIPFIRARTINFTVEGAKPNTRLYAFFDDVNVDNFITPTSGLQTDIDAGILKTDGAGKATGTFAIPGGRFRTGERTLRFIDRTDNNVKLSNTKAEGIYTAQGTLTTTQDTITAIRQPVLRTQTVRERIPMPDVVTRSLTTSENTTTTWIDPLAQSFLIDPRVYPKGLFLSSIDLYFATKDESLPITLQIRPTVNGYPSSSIIVPGSEVTLNASQVNVSDNPDIANSSTATNFAFENLIYLEAGEYTFVVLSNSNQYEVYVGEIGELSVNGNFLITENPYAGVMFKSQNASTWTAVQEDDIMFKINRASFNIDTATTVTFNVDPTDVPTDIIYDLFQLTCNDFKPNDTTINYSYNYTDYLNNVNSNTGIIPNDNAVLRTKGKLDANTDTGFVLTATLTSNDETVSPIIDDQTLQLITISNVINNGGIKDNLIVILNGGTGYSNTDIISAISDTGSGASISPIVEAGVITDVIVNSTGNGYTGDVTFEVLKPDGSPSDGTSASFAFISETSNEGGNADARYITRRVTLSKGFESNYLYVSFKGLRPPNANFDVYYKVLNSNDPEDIDNKNYVKMSLDPATNQFSTGIDDFREYIYKPTDGNIVYTVGNSEYSTFDTFLIKIVLRSDGTTNYEVPRLKELKVIAFAP